MYFALANDLALVMQAFLMKNGNKSQGLVWLFNGIAS